MLVGISMANPIFITVLIPLAIFYWFIQLVYVKSARQLKRLESVARSPIYSFFSETLAGISTIRAYNVQEDFLEDNRKKVDYSQIAFQPNLVSNRWLSIRLEILGNIIVMVACILIIISRDTQSAGMVGMSLTYALQITNMLSFFIRQTSQIETNMVCLERVKEYQDELPREAPHFIPQQDPPSSWPKYGSIVMKNYQTRYREGLDLVLRGITCRIMVCNELFQLSLNACI